MGSKPTRAKVQPSKAPPPIPPKPVKARGSSDQGQVPIDPAIISYGRLPNSKVGKEALATATLSGPFNDLSLSKEAKDESETAELGINEDTNELAKTRKRGKRNQGATATNNSSRYAGKSFVAPTGPEQLSEDLDDSSIVQERSATAIRKPRKILSPIVDADGQGMKGFLSVPKSKKQAKQSSRVAWRKAAEGQNGWATEDATDIQELGDFDFQANLSKFDKRGVFEQLRADDTVDLSSRLVSHNRLAPRAGTAGGKNLHWTENVLDSASAINNGQWNSEAGESGEDISEAKVSSGQNSRRNLSRSGARVPLRRGSAMTEATGIEGWGTGSRLMTNAIGGIRQSSMDNAGSPGVKPKGATPNSSFLGPSNTGPTIAPTPKRPTLRIIDSNKPCPYLSPLQMLEYEQHAITELGLTEDILHENAARGIADASIRTLGDVKARTPSSQNLHIIVLAGNHRTGARAVAAARHLRNHGFKVSTAVLGFERPDELLDSVQTAVNAYRKAGGAILKPAELLALLKAIPAAATGVYEAGSSATPALLVDALLGVHAAFYDLRRDEQAWCFEVILLANRRDLRVLSVDVSSGMDAISGEIVGGEEGGEDAVAFRSLAVVSLGAPKTWVLSGSLDKGVRLWVVDLGVGSAGWRRFGSRRRKGVEFGGSWVVEVEVQTGGT